MPELRVFDAPIERQIDREKLAWPGDEAPSEEEFEGNALYSDLRDLGWNDVAERALAERAAIAAYLAGEISVSETGCDDVPDSDDDFDDFADQGIRNVDLGVASAVAALSAVGCIPFTSCNAGSLGGAHSAPYPIVRFFAPREIAGELLDSAEEAGVGKSLRSHRISPPCRAQPKYWPSYASHDVVDRL